MSGKNKSLGRQTDRHQTQVTILNSFDILSAKQILNKQQIQHTMNGWKAYMKVRKKYRFALLKHNKKNSNILADSKLVLQENTQHNFKCHLMQWQYAT